jgi:hypothetical protein
MKFHKDGTQPQLGEIFVFGSNQSGIHGAGAARAAFEHFDAEWGFGEGITGNSYALPTKDYQIESRSLIEIEDSVQKFLDIVAKNPNMEFWVTRIGCGLAGYNDEDIAPMFFCKFSNISFPNEWKRYVQSRIKF